jgi:hypothetical protein
MSDGPIYQPRCPRCLAEHYALDVPAVSRGAPCLNCGHSKVYTNDAEYIADLRAARAAPSG